MTLPNLLSEWARLLVESLAAAGIRDLIISPGSRSTPLAWAALSSSRLECTSVVDERAAAFFAVGRAKITGAPCAVLCTSGSAAANYFPAVVEASQSRTPLVVVTADRPFELMDCGASQTMDQNRLYGGYVRAFVDVGMPDAERAALVGLRRRVMQAVFQSQGDEPGPVHLNVRMRKPLEPRAATGEPTRALAAQVDALIASPEAIATAAKLSPADGAMRELEEAALASRAGLVVCGPSNPASPRRAVLLERYARAAGVAVYAEATSQLRFAGAPQASTLDALELLLRDPRFRTAFRPDFVLQLGAPPTSSAWERFLGSPRDTPRYVVTPHGWPDPHGTARAVIRSAEEPVLERLALAAESAPSRAAPPFWLRANAAAWQVVDTALARAGEISEGSAVRAAVRALPEGGLFAVGNSLPVRHADAFCRAADARAVVWSQRGVAGIDGVVAGAAGAAAALGRPAVLAVGDVSALHDVGGFAVAAAVRTPFVVMILNNDGGRIFEQLPFASEHGDSDRLSYWTTPHGRSFSGLAALYGVDYARVETAAALEETLAHGLLRPGCTVIEVRVPPHGAREVDGQILSGLESALSPLVALPD